METSVGTSRVCKVKQHYLETNIKLKIFNFIRLTLRRQKGPKLNMSSHLEWREGGRRLRYHLEDVLRQRRQHGVCGGKGGGELTQSLLQHFWAWLGLRLDTYFQGK